MKCRVCASLTCPPPPTTQPRETLSKGCGVASHLVASPSHLDARGGWLPRRPSTNHGYCCGSPTEREKPSDGGVNWATIVPPPPLFLSLLRDTRARWPLAPTRPWPRRGTKVAWIALPSRNHRGVCVCVYRESRSMLLVKTKRCYFLSLEFWWTFLMKRDWNGFEGKAFLLSRVYLQFGGRNDKF